jgi:hypothetical protein
MRYWWVHQNQTFRHEIGDGYLWSPKRNANGARNPVYESMREVAPGDVTFSCKLVLQGGRTENQPELFLENQQDDNGRHYE